MVKSGGKGRFTGNKIFNNLNSGVQVEKYSHPVFTNNQIFGNGDFGIEVFEGGGGSYEENILFSNRKGPLRIDFRSKDKVVLKGNRFSKE